MLSHRPSRGPLSVATRHTVNVAGSGSGYGQNLGSGYGQNLDLGSGDGQNLDLGSAMVHSRAQVGHSFGVCVRVMVRIRFS